MASPLYLAHGDVASAPLDRDHLLAEALEAIVRDYPPQAAYGADQLKLQIPGTHQDHWRHGYATMLCEWGCRLLATTE